MFLPTCHTFTFHNAFPHPHTLHHSTAALNNLHTHTHPHYDHPASTHSRQSEAGVALLATKHWEETHGGGLDLAQNRSRKDGREGLGSSDGAWLISERSEWSSLSLQNTNYQSFDLYVMTRNLSSPTLILKLRRGTSNTQHLFTLAIIKKKRKIS